MVGTEGPLLMVASGNQLVWNWGADGWVFVNSERFLKVHLAVQFKQQHPTASQRGLSGCSRIHELVVLPFTKDSGAPHRFAAWSSLSTAETPVPAWKEMRKCGLNQG